MGTGGLLGHRYGREGRPGCWSLEKKGGREMRQEGKADSPPLTSQNLSFCTVASAQERNVITHFVNQTEWMNEWQWAVRKEL